MLDSRLREIMAHYQAVLDVLWNSFGKERLIYESNWPCSKHTGTYASYRELVNQFISARGQEARERFYWKNAAEAYRLPLEWPREGCVGEDGKWLPRATRRLNSGMENRTALAIFAHPDDIEFSAAGTLLLLRERGWAIHYFDLCNGCGGSVQMDAPTTAATRLREAGEAALILGAVFHPPIAEDLELTYRVDYLRKVAAVVREVKPSIVLTHSPEDYMEDHMSAARLAVTAAFAHGIPNFRTDPPRDAWDGDVTVYHAMPHGLCDPLRQNLRAGLYVNTTDGHESKRAALAAHQSQKHWLDITQGMASYLESLDEMSRAVGQLSGCFEHAEGWRRHLHYGFSKSEADPLRDALGDDCFVDEAYESSLATPR